MVLQKHFLPPYYLVLDSQEWVNLLYLLVNDFLMFSFWDAWGLSDFGSVKALSSSILFASGLLRVGESSLSS